MARQAQVTRNTNETQISVSLNLDGSGKARLATGVGFLDHMLEQIARHGVFDLDVSAKGDLHIDAHTIAIGIRLSRETGDLRLFGNHAVKVVFGKEKVHSWVVSWLGSLVVDTHSS